MTTIFSSALQGVSFRGKEVKELVMAFTGVETFTFEREPDNAYDANAVRIIYDDTFIGYVEASVAEEIAPLLDEGYVGKGTILSFLSPTKPHIQIELTLDDAEASAD